MKIIQDENELKKLVSFMEKNGMETIRGYGTFDEFKKDILDKNHVLYIGYLKDKNNKKNEAQQNETHFIIEELEKDEDGNYQPTGVFMHYWDYNIDADEYVENLLKTNNIKSQDSNKRRANCDMNDNVELKKKIEKIEKQMDDLEERYYVVIDDDEDYYYQDWSNEKAEEKWCELNGIKNKLLDELDNLNNKNNSSKITRAECLKRAEFWLNKAENLKCNVITKDDIEVDLGNRAIAMGYIGHIEDIEILDKDISFRLDGTDHFFDLEGDKWVSQKIYDAYIDIYYNEETGKFDKKSYKEDKELDEALEDELNKIYKDKIEQLQKRL